MCICFVVAYATLECLVDVGAFHGCNDFFFVSANHVAFVISSFFFSEAIVVLNHVAFYSCRDFFLLFKRCRSYHTWYARDFDDKS